MPTSRTHRLAITVAAILLLVGAPIAYGMDDHQLRFYRCPIQLGTSVAALADASDSQTTIYVRYKGYTCSHCVRQLTYLDEHHEALRRLGIRVVAFSSDDAETSKKMVTATGLHTDVFALRSDADDALARTIGALRIENDTVRDLHAVLVVSNGLLRFAAYTEEPYMDVERIIAAASHTNAVGAESETTMPHLDYDLDPDKPAAGYGAASGKGLRSYDKGYTVRTIATANDGVREPKDLEFNTSLLHPNDLWVVMAEPVGHSMLIVHDADKPSQVIRYKKDSRASHFMWRTQALAFGTNGTFATAQNGEPGGPDQDYQFMGPTLWSSDTAIFASKYQDDEGMLASHLDMLHQNAYCLGIAHERDNVYWISDALHGTIGRYDFKDPHEVGGTDHRDGVIRNYTDAKLSTNEHGRAAHVAFDADKRWLYFIDPGANTIKRLDTRSGKDTRPLSTTIFSDELLASFREFTGAKVEPVLQYTKDVGPIGLHIDGHYLIVGNADGTILVYELTDTLPKLKHTLDVSPSVAGGVTVGPDGRIWFTDHVNATVNVIDPDEKETLVAAQTVRITPRQQRLALDLGIVRPNCDVASYRIAVTAPKGWTIDAPDTITISATGSPNFVVGATPDSSAVTGYITVHATALEGTSTLVANILVSRSDIRQVVVNDATTEGFDIVEALVQTGRKGYVPMSSGVLLQLMDSLRNIQTVVWNAGSFGEINMAEDVVMRSFIASEREILLIADDPLMLRTDHPDAAGLFAEFGAKLVGIDAPASGDDGVRVFQGVPGDPITAGMSGLECQLPRLNHTRGGNYVPNMKLGLAKPGATSILLRSNNTIISAVRYENLNFRSVICGINVARFVDAEERTAFLNKSLTWLEAAAEPVVDPTGVAEEPPTVASGALRVTGTNPFAEFTTVSITANSAHADVALYTITGQRVATLWQGAVDGAADVRVDGRSLSAGTYYVIMRDGTHVSHCTLVKSN